MPGLHSCTSHARHGGMELTVVAQSAHGLGKRPAGGCVGGEAPVVDGEGCGVGLILQVLVVLGHRCRSQHPLQAPAIIIQREKKDLEAEYMDEGFMGGHSNMSASIGEFGK